MTDRIQLTLDDPRVLMRALELAVERLAQTPMQVAAQILTHLRDSIEEQVKPAVEEPFEFGSVVSTRTDGLFVRLGAAMALPWGNGGALRTWDQLDVVEVLRVGIGEPSNEQQAAAKYETTVALGEAYSRGYHEGVESNLPSPVDHSVINSAISEAAAEIIAREGRLLGVGYAHELTDAVMKALT